MLAKIQRAFYMMAIEESQLIESMAWSYAFARLLLG